MGGVKELYAGGGVWMADVRRSVRSFHGSDFFALGGWRGCKWLMYDEKSDFFILLHGSPG